MKSRRVLLGVYIGNCNCVCGVGGGVAADDSLLAVTAGDVWTAACFPPLPKHMNVKWVTMIANPQEEKVHYPLEHFQSGVAKCLGG